MLHTSEHEKGHSSRQYHGMFSADLNLKYHIKKGHEKFGNAHLHNFFKNKKGNNSKLSILPLYKVTIYILLSMKN